MKAKKHLGQHFLTSKKVLADMVKASSVDESDTILEIGPGKGVLTRALLDTGARVFAIETDADMVIYLQKSFTDDLESEHLTLIHDDVLDINIGNLLPERYKVVANIPYYITGILLRRLLSGTTLPVSITILVQKEVAHRIATDKKESILSLSIKVYGQPRYVTSVPARYFSPTPKVDSAVLHIDSISKKFFTDITEERFFKIIKAGFANKRKQLINNLSGFATKENVSSILQEIGLSEHIRAEDIHLEDWKKLIQAL